MSSVDVIVPCYRYGRYLEDCVHSVLDQACVEVRVLVIDDASPDDTPDVCGRLMREDPRVEVVRHADNQGHIRTYNEGIDWASADHLLLLSADDYLLPGALARASQLLDAYPDVGLVFGRCVELDENGSLRAATTPAHAGLANGSRILPSEAFVRLSVDNIVPTPTAVMRTKVQKRIGGYRAELPHTADLEMWLRAASQGPVGVLGDYQAVYRRHGENMSSGYLKHHRLRDLNQRLDALEFFFGSSGRALQGAACLRRQLLADLAREAVHSASAAFNDGLGELSRELVQFALTTDPEIRRSAAWRRFRFKRSFGLRGWRMARATLDGMRQLVASPRENAG